MAQKITLKELSQLLNLSVSTISKSLNNSPEISENTKRRVKEVALLNRYIPNVAAKNLKAQRTRSIGVIIPSIRSPFFSEVVQGIEGQARKMNYKVIICITHESLEKEKACVENLIESRVDGIILSPSRETQSQKNINHINTLYSYDIPFVLFDRLIDSLKCDKISIDDTLHAELAANELFNAGSRKIGFISDRINICIHEKRKAGYVQAMKSLRLPLCTIEFENSFPSRKILDKVRNNQLDGILASTETVAIHTMRYLLQAGVNIPEEVAVIGFSNSNISKYFMPSLSAIDQCATHQGELAMETLADRLSGKLSNELMTYKLNAQIIHRQSTRNIKEQIA